MQQAALHSELSDGFGSGSLRAGSTPALGTPGSDPSGVGLYGSSPPNRAVSGESLYTALVEQPRDVPLCESRPLLLLWRAQQPRPCVGACPLYNRLPHPVDSSRLACRTSFESSQHVIH
jgi:hypothetical protein